MPSVPSVVDLRIGGMTCASCAARVEKKLNRLDGVTATVNFATETAHVEFPTAMDTDDLIRAVVATGYSAARPAPMAESHVDAARRRLIVSVLLSVPVMALAMIPALRGDASGWIAFALATPVIAWCAWPFHRAAAVNLRHGAATMDTLISLGALTSYAWSAWGLITGTEMYLEVGVSLTTFLLAGRFFEARAKRRAGSALRALLELGAKDVAVVDATGAEVRVPIGDLRVGDRFVVRPGEHVATDGVVVEGASAVDASMLTGESVPIDVGVGDAVVGATINAGGRIVVRATLIGADTRLAQMARLVTEAQSGKAPVQRLADRIAGVFVPSVIVIALGTFAGRLLAGSGAAVAMTTAVAVLIVACPCALGLATPMALLVGTGRGAALGIVIRGPHILEATRRVDTVVLDKTGTLTTGVMAVVDVSPVAGTDADELLRIAASVEYASEHPIARAIVTAAQDANRPLSTVRDFANRPGLGAVGTVDGHAVIVGRPRLLTASGITVPDGPRTGTTVAIAWDGALRGTVTVSDTVRPTSAYAVARLRDLGLRPVLLTGDDHVVAQAVAAEVGIDEVIADVLPEGKLDAIRALRRDGRVVAMVGDGVNDAAALAAADLGVAMGSGTDVAIQASDLTLVRSDLVDVANAIRLSRATLRTIKGNLFWAFAYNVAAIPLAAAGLVTPMLAAAAMALSSVFVVSNSLRLFRFTPTTASPPASPTPRAILESTSRISTV